LISLVVFVQADQICATDDRQTDRQTSLMIKATYPLWCRA